MGLKLYHVSDSPPCLAVRMGLKYLGVEVELIDVDFLKAEQATELYRKKNPQGEVPLLDDNGFLLSESVAILQYLADRYRVDDTFYPVEAKARALVNHRLAFHLSTYYKAIAEYVILPMCYAYKRTPEKKKMVNHSLSVFEELLSSKDAGPYATGKNLTIADLSLIMGTGILQEVVIEEGIQLPVKVKGWYDHFKGAHPELWALAEAGLKELREFEKNPPDFSGIQHPVHPTDKTQLQN